MAANRRLVDDEQAAWHRTEHGAFELQLATGETISPGAKLRASPEGVRRMDAPNSFAVGETGITSIDRSHGAAFRLPIPRQRQEA